MSKNMIQYIKPLPAKTKKRLLLMGLDDISNLFNELTGFCNTIIDSHNVAQETIQKMEEKKSTQNEIFEKLRDNWTNS